MAINSVFPGNPQPFGVSHLKDGCNFAIFSRHAIHVNLCLFDSQWVLNEIPLDSHRHKTGDVWHVKIGDLGNACYYAFRLDGPQGECFSYDKHYFLLDPYAKVLSTSHLWASNSNLLTSNRRYTPFGVIPRGSRRKEFDWQNVPAPNLPVQDLILYEMHVRGFTIHSSSQTKYPGTFLGVIEKIPYLLDLGVNALEILPIQEFDENEVQLYSNPEIRRLHNYWGYSTVNFFAPMNRYAISEAIAEFKTMVRELHRHGIEVILDVVFNHTAEGDATGPIFSFKGIDSPIYYLYSRDYHLSNYTGCGNTFNCNHPVVRQFIIDCLRYWHLEMGVDGFRFDLASILTRGRSGEPLQDAPIVEAITEDPLLASAKMIAEPWDAVGLYHVGNFFPKVKRWSEWNGRYRDAVRKFIKGTPGENIRGEFITRICGSQDLYAPRTPQNSINFVTCHDGFSLCDLVSYNHKHNDGNGEHNRDGNPQNESWNCGVEGATSDPKINHLRERQMKNFHLALVISLGIPMFHMGDEYAHTKQGNNNTWCQDNELNWFLWDQLEAHRDFFRFYQKLIHFRRKTQILKRTSFLTPDDVEWHGLVPGQPNWHVHTGVAAFTLLDKAKGEHLYIIFNAESNANHVILPSPKENRPWRWIVNTYSPSPSDFFEHPVPLDHLERTIPPFTAWMLQN